MRRSLAVVLVKCGMLVTICQWGGKGQGVIVWMRLIALTPTEGENREDAFG